MSNFQWPAVAPLFNSDLATSMKDFQHAAVKTPALYLHQPAVTTATLDGVLKSRKLWCSESRTAKSCQSSKALWTDRLSENCPATVRQSGVSNTNQGNCNHPDRRIILDKKQHLQPYIRPISPPRRRRTGPRPTSGIPSETSPQHLLMTGSGIRGGFTNS